ncbi:MAG TPA: hypothetical protein VMT47_02230 [Polyangia bacterium]|nr:hypothetical protein [Polyangia bacterium]
MVPSDASPEHSREASTVANGPLPPSGAAAGQTSYAAAEGETGAGEHTTWCPRSVVESPEGVQEISKPSSAEIALTAVGGDGPAAPRVIASDGSLAIRAPSTRTMAHRRDDDVVAGQVDEPLASENTCAVETEAVADVCVALKVRLPPTAAHAVVVTTSQSLPISSCASTVCASRFGAAVSLTERPTTMLEGHAHRAMEKKLAS